MQLGMIGLGRMGGNIVRRLVSKGHECVVFDQNADAIKALAGDKIGGSSGLADMVKKLSKPRAVWVMLPAGEITEKTVVELGNLMEAGDTIIDGGNAFFQDDVRRGKALKSKGIHYIDCGTSGGVWGLERGYCMMIGGDKEAVDRLDPIFNALAPGAGTITKTPRREKRDPRVEQGYLHCGPVGSGHYVKMVHNGIEYGIMQAYAEGFSLFNECEFELDNAKIAHLWMQGSVIRSWLCELAANAFEQDGNDLAELEPWVEDSGEGRWTVESGIDLRIATPVITTS